MRVAVAGLPNGPLGSFASRPFALIVAAIFCMLAVGAIVISALTGRPTQSGDGLKRLPDGELEIAGGVAARLPNELVAPAVLPESDLRTLAQRCGSAA